MWLAAVTLTTGGEVQLPNLQSGVPYADPKLPRMWTIGCRLYAPPAGHRYEITFTEASNAAKAGKAPGKLEVNPPKSTRIGIPPTAVGAGVVHVRCVSLMTLAETVPTAPNPQLGVVADPAPEAACGGAEAEPVPSSRLAIARKPAPVMTSALEHPMPVPEGTTPS